VSAPSTRLPLLVPSGHHADLTPSGVEQSRSGRFARRPTQTCLRCRTGISSATSRALLSADTALPERRLATDLVPRGRATQPGVNLGGGGWPDHFYAGGEIYRAGADIAQVELRFANGVTLSDDADADVALFITESAVQLPVTAVLLGPVANVATCSTSTAPSNQRHARLASSACRTESWKASECTTERRRDADHRGGRPSNRESGRQAPLVALVLCQGCDDASRTCFGRARSISRNADPDLLCAASEPPRDWTRLRQSWRLRPRRVPAARRLQGPR